MTEAQGYFWIGTICVGLLWLTLHNRVKRWQERRKEKAKANYFRRKNRSLGK